MRFKTPAVITATLLLAACNKSSDSVSLKNAQVDQVAAVQKANQIKPGEWEVTAEVVKQETTGGPPALANMPKAPPTTLKVCITPEQASKPDAMFGKGMEQFKKSCIYDKFEMANGSMSAEMHCDLAGGPKLKSSTSGTFSDTAMSTEGKSEVTMPGGMTMKSETKMTAKRLGECQPGDQQPGVPKAG